MLWNIYELVIAALALWVLVLSTLLVVNARFRHHYADWLMFKDPLGIAFCIEHPIFFLYSLATFGGAAWVLFF